MKKLYALAAAALAAFSASAQSLYVVGAGDGLAWTPDDPMEVALQGDAYTFTVDDLVQFKISTAKGEWTDFNAAALCCPDITKEQLGTPVDLSAGDGNIGTPWKGNYTVVVAGNLTTITLTTDTPEPAGFTPVYLRGTMNGWSAVEEWQMTTTDGKNYTFQCGGDKVITAADQFKIADDSWGNINYGAGGAVSFDTEMTWNYNGNNSTLASDFAGEVRFTLPDALKGPATVYFDTTVGIDGIAADSQEPAEYYNLQGVRVLNPEGGLYIVRRGDRASKQLVR